MAAEPGSLWSTASAILGEPPAKKRKKEVQTPQPEEFAAFFSLLEDSHVKLFLARDSCFMISDKYLLAMVLEYFRRARISIEKYRKYFFPALFLANQMEEEGKCLREIYAWDLGANWKWKTEDLHERRNELLLRLGFRTWVDRDTCVLIMAKHRLYWAWARDRRIHHGWAIRSRDAQELTINGPWRIPPPCSRCNTDLILPCKRKGQTDIKVAPGTAES
ncbi:speedy protein C-like isoform X2 [Dendropsophus ebraccatus]|uniref:speedy protein C-like isoform X2 n=1 Tax=Dendropsophus ebraccatus TaxID=150705 RepID=UPI0038321363